MPTLPPAADFTATGITEGQFKTALTQLIGYLDGLMGSTGNPANALAKMGAPLNAYMAISAAYTVLAEDRGKFIDATSGTFTLTLPNAGGTGIGDGFPIALRNSGTGVVTVDGFSSQSVDGLGSIALAQGQSLLLICTGTNWKSVGLAPSEGLDIQTFSTPGANTWIKPPKGSLAIIECWGGGGAGAFSNSISFAAHGGGGGGYNTRTIPLSQLGATETVTVGAGGTGGSRTSGGVTNGNSGGHTTFGGHCKAWGGKGGGVITAGAYSSAGGPLEAGSETYLVQITTCDNDSCSSQLPAMVDLHGSSAWGPATGGVWWGGSGGFATSSIYLGGGVYPGGNSVYGGGGGGGSGYTHEAGGTSTYGGNGGAGGDASPLPVSGAQPGGGGGGSCGSGITSGAGGAGRCVVTVI